jgi:hypothetical protein
LIILIGDFIDKHSILKLTSEEIISIFERLFDSVLAHERLSKEVKLLLIPGPNDPGSDLLLP